MKFVSAVEDVKLVMWEKVDMPESVAGKDVAGKTVFNKTGKTIEMTNYIFRDGFGEKLVAMSKDNAYRTLEGEMVDIAVDIQFNDFTKKNKVSLVDCKIAK